jgi:DNA polymerase delta subunit 1
MLCFVLFFYQNKLREVTDRPLKTLQRHVLRVEITHKQSICGYHENGMSNFLKITVALPSLVKIARRILESGLLIPDAGLKQFITYESNIPYVLRYMIDKQIRGGGW